MEVFCNISAFLTTFDASLIYRVGYSATHFLPLVILCSGLLAKARYYVFICVVVISAIFAIVELVLAAHLLSIRQNNLVFSNTSAALVILASAITIAVGIVML